MSGNSRFSYLAIAILALAATACVTSDPAPAGPTAEPTSTPQPTVTPTPASDSAPSSTAASEPGLTPTPTAAPPEDISYTRRTPFVPLDNPAFLTVAQAAYLPDDDLVMGLEWQGQSRAYPARMLRFHHIVNDTVAGRPILVTF